MTKLNDPGCTTAGHNTGRPSCVIIPKNIVGAVLIPKTLALTAAEVATSAAFITKMQALVLNPPATRVYPIGPFAEITDKSEEPVYSTTGYAVKQFVREGKIGWQFGITVGGIGLQNALRAFNQTKSHSLLFYDSENTVFGVDDGNGGMMGFDLEDFYAHPWKASDGSNPAKFMCEVMFEKTRQLNDDLVYLKLESDFDSVIKGLIDLELELVSQTSTKAVIRVWTKNAKVNLYALYSTALASLSVWTVTKAGATVTPTGVSAIAATEAFEFTLTTPAGAHDFTLVTPALLDAANIGGPPDNGYESDSLSVTFS